MKRRRAGYEIPRRRPDSHLTNVFDPTDLLSRGPRRVLRALAI